MLIGLWSDKFHCQFRLRSERANRGSFSDDEMKKSIVLSVWVTMCLVVVGSLEIQTSGMCLSIISLYKLKSPHHVQSWGLYWEISPQRRLQWARRTFRLLIFVLVESAGFKYELAMMKVCSPSPTRTTCMSSSFRISLQQTPFLTNVVTAGVKPAGYGSLASRLAHSTLFIPIGNLDSPWKATYPLSVVLANDSWMHITSGRTAYDIHLALFSYVLPMNTVDFLAFQDTILRESPVFLSFALSIESIMSFSRAAASFTMLISRRILAWSLLFCFFVIFFSALKRRRKSCFLDGMFIYMGVVSISYLILGFI